MTDGIIQVEKKLKNKIKNNKKDKPIVFLFPVRTVNFLFRILKRESLCAKIKIIPNNNMAYPIYVTDVPNVSLFTERTVPCSSVS